MSSWGRWLPSPFSSRTEEASSSNTDYYTEDDRSYRKPYQTQHHEPRQLNRPQRPIRDDDILVFRHKNTNYPVKFPAYSIDDHRLTVGYAREKASEKLGLHDPDQLRMIHKGKKLDEDGAFFDDLGFRSDHPAEIYCTVVGPPMNRPQDDAGSDGEEGSEDENSATPSGAGGKKRKNKKKKKRGGNKTPANASSSSLPYPAPGVEYLPMPSSLHPATRLPTSPTTPTSTTGASTPSHQPAKLPPAALTPLAKLDAIASAFHTTLVPQCIQFMHHPPEDEVRRKFEHKKLTETILTTVMIKLDGVETEGDVEARARRKELVREAQGMMAQLDDAAGGVVD